VPFLISWQQCSAYKELFFEKQPAMHWGNQGWQQQRFGRGFMVWCPAKERL